MIGGSIHRSARDHPVRAATLFLIVSVIAILFAANVSLGYVPRGAQNHVAIIVRYDYAYPAQIEREISIPVENAVSGLEGVSRVESHIEAGQSRTLLTVSERVKLSEIATDVGAAIQRIGRTFPPAAHRPIVVTSDPESAPVFVVAFPARSDITEQSLRSVFESVDGVGQVDVVGAPRSEITIRPFELASRSSGIENATLLRAISDTAYPRVIRVVGSSPLLYDERASSLDQLRQVPTRPTGVSLGALATVRYSSGEQRSLSRINGQRGTSVYVRQAGDANPVGLCRELRRVASQMSDSEVIYDYGKLIESALKEIAVSLAIGMALVALVTAALVGRRAAPALVLSIPFSVLVAVAAISAFDLELNVLALGGIVLGIGIAIDSGIVYADAFNHHDGDAVQTWTAIGGPLMVSTATTLVVFLPLIFAGPRLAGRFLPIVVSFSSTVVATLVFIVAVAPALLRHARTPQPASEPSDPRRTFSSKREPYSLPVIFVLVVFSATILAGLFVGGSRLEELPNAPIRVEGDNRIDITYDFPAGTRFDDVVRRASRIEDLLVSDPAARIVVSRYEGERGEFQIVPQSDVAMERMNAIVQAAQRTDPTGTIIIGGSQSPERWIPIRVSGSSHDTVRELSRRVSETIAPAIGVDSRVVFHFKRAPEANEIRLHTSAFASSAAPPTNTVSEVFSFLSEPVVLKLQLLGEERDVRVLRDEDPRPTLSALRDFRVSLGNIDVPLSMVSTFVATTNPNTLDRSALRPTAALSVVTPSATETEALVAIERALSALNLPAGYSATIDEAYYEAQTANRTLVLGLIAGSILVVCVMLVYYQSVRKTVAAVFAVPLSLAVPVVSFAAFASQLSQSVIVGLIIASGLAVNHSVLVIDRIDEVAAAGLPIRVAIRAALRGKRRAMVAATATTIVGVVPALVQSASSGSALGPLTISLALGSIGAVAAAYLSVPIVMLTGRFEASPEAVHSK